MNSDPIKKAVVAVLMPREHLPFIREWCLYHIATGWEIFIYDNTGSEGSIRKTSSFFSGKWQKSKMDKRGNNYGRYTDSMSDEEVQIAFAAELADLKVTVVPWQPRDAAARIVHGQVEAYVNFILTHGSAFSWAAFIDADEYLHTASGLSWDAALTEMQKIGCFRLQLEGLVYESRWTRDGQPRSLGDLSCCGKQVGGQKNIVMPAMALMADIHWGWRMKGGNQYANPDPTQLHFRHYKGETCTYHFDVHALSCHINESESVPVVAPLPVDIQDPDTPCFQPIMDKFTSWRISDDLEKYIRFKLPRGERPARIMELGPGYSTMLFSRLFPDANIISLEHCVQWYEREKNYLGKIQNLDLRLVSLHPETCWYDIDLETVGPCDLLLVDGPPGSIAPLVREGALALIGKLTPNAIVILNNTDRINEKSSVQKWISKGCKIETTYATFTVLRYCGPQVDQAQDARTS